MIVVFFVCLSKPPWIPVLFFNRMKLHFPVREHSLLLPFCGLILKVFACLQAGSTVVEGESEAALLERQSESSGEGTCYELRIY